MLLLRILKFLDMIQSFVLFYMSLIFTMSGPYFGKNIYADGKNITSTFNTAMLTVDFNTQKMLYWASWYRYIWSVKHITINGIEFNERKFRSLSLI